MNNIFISINIFKECYIKQKNKTGVLENFLSLTKKNFFQEKSNHFKISSFKVLLIVGL